MNCIDPRFTTWTWAYMGCQGWANLYSQFTIAGGPVAAVVDSDPFKTWQKAWWDNLAVSIQLHQVKRVVGLCHRDCGAAVLAYGDKIKTDPAFETAKLSRGAAGLPGRGQEAPRSRCPISASWA